jgi:hypothetical protein
MEIMETSPTLELLHIKNFAGIKEAEFEFKRLSVLIGPQASGKSICAKLVYFFREIVRSLSEAVLLGHNIQQIKQDHIETFLKYFPHSSWNRGVFEIEYHYGSYSVRARRPGAKSSTVEIRHSSYFDSLYTYARMIHDDGVIDPFAGSGRLSLDLVHTNIYRKVSREISPGLANRNFFIPAGRSYFALLRRGMFSILAGNIQFDPFLIEFGKLYEWIRASHLSQNAKGKDYEGRISRVLGGTYEQDEIDEFIFMADGRRVPVEVASSGQQEVLPLALLLPRIYGNLIVEEPEAHLFPDTQKEIVYLLASTAKLASGDGVNQYLITTHSPYILTSINNLMYASKIIRDFPSRRDDVINVMGHSDLIDPSQVAAYVMSDGTAKSIIDADSELVLASAIDGVSGSLAKEFDRLLDIEFEEKAA